MSPQPDGRSTRWKRRVIAAARDSMMPADEPVVVAMAQPAPSLPFYVGLGLCCTLFIGGVLDLGGLNLPLWVGILGLLGGGAIALAHAYLPPHAVVRTARRVYVFRISRDERSPDPAPVATFAVDQLAGRTAEPFGAPATKLWAHYGKSKEREALKAAFAARGG